MNPLRTAGFSLETLTRLWLSSVAVLGLGAAPALALPRNGSVAAGQATIATQGGTMSITQGTARAIINWKDFSIRKNETVRFAQPSNGAILNRVTSSSPSAIYGQLQGNGQVYLINPNGILIGPSGRIDTNGFVATTLDVPNRDFMAGGPLAFAGGSTARVENYGTIRGGAGDVILMARNVVNGGTIESPGGTAALAAGNDIVYAPAADQRIVVRSALPGGGTGVDNSGRIEAAQAELRAAGGNVFALAVNNTGLVSAKGVATIGGRVVIGADDGVVAVGGTVRAAAGVDGGAIAVTGGDVRMTGTLDASGWAGHGGTVTVAGDAITLAASSRIDAGGDTGGGRVAIGGGPRPAAPLTKTAGTVTVERGAAIVVDARRTGDGGQVTVWSDRSTRFDGTVSAQGGAAGGNGGFVETSSKGALTVGDDTRVDTRAVRGQTGTWLLDPADIVIANSGGTTTPTVVQNNLALGNVMLDSNSGTGSPGDITVSNAITWTNANTLTLNSANNIVFNAGVTGSAGSLVIKQISGNAQSVSSSAGAALTAGAITISMQGSLNLAGVVTTPTLTFDSLGSATNAPVALSVANTGNALGTVNFAFTGLENIKTIAITSAAAQPLVLTGGNGFTSYQQIATLPTPHYVDSTMTIVAQGDLILGSTFKMGHQGPTILASLTGHVINNSTQGANVFNAQPGGAPITQRYAIYQADNTSSALNGLTGTTMLGVSYPNDPQPGSNMLYFASAPPSPPPPPTTPTSPTATTTPPSVVVGPTVTTGLVSKPGLVLDALGANQRLDTVQVPAQGASGTITIGGNGIITATAGQMFKDANGGTLVATGVQATVAPVGAISPTQPAANLVTATAPGLGALAQLPGGNFPSDLNLAGLHSMGLTDADVVAVLGEIQAARDMSLSYDDLRSTKPTTVQQAADALNQLVTAGARGQISQFLAAARQGDPRPSYPSEPHNAVGLPTVTNGLIQGLAQQYQAATGQVPTPANLVPQLVATVQQLALKPPDQLTPAETALVQSVQSYIRAQKVAADQEALTMYTNWRQTGNVDGTPPPQTANAGSNLQGLYNPTGAGAPPDSIMQTAQAGFAFTDTGRVTAIAVGAAQGATAIAAAGAAAGVSIATDGGAIAASTLSSSVLTTLAPFIGASGMEVTAGVAMGAGGPVGVIVGAIVMTGMAINQVVQEQEFPKQLQAKMLLDQKTTPNLASFAGSDTGTAQLTAYMTSMVAQYGGNGGLGS